MLTEIVSIFQTEGYKSGGLEVRLIVMVMLVVHLAGRQGD